MSESPPSQETEEEEEQTDFLMALKEKPHGPIVATVKLNNSQVQFEVDTGASRTVIGEDCFKEMQAAAPGLVLLPSEVVLRSFTGEKVEVKGKTRVNVHYEGQTATLDVLVVRSQGPNLLGRDWMGVLRLNWKELFKPIFKVSDNALQNVLSKHNDIFRDELGTLKGMEVRFHVNTAVKPRYCKARPVPFAMRSKIEAELDRLQAAGVIEPVTHSEWSAPIVAVMKPDSTVRICGDYKLTANVASRLEQYPLPRIEELFSTLAGGTSYSKLDMSHAYQQLVLAEESRKLVTINTHKGLFQYTRLPFGVSSACAIFQRTMENLLAGIPHTTVYLDDVLLTGPSEEVHLQTLSQVLTRLEEAGLRLKRSKCVFMAPAVEYLGHRVSAAGLQPLEKKVRAIREALEPKNVTELRAYLGMINYYGRFLPDLSTVLAPLHSLLKAGVTWGWGSQQHVAFQRSKDLLSASTLLVHYDPQRPLIITCDASPYGVGAVLSHSMDGTERPVCFASRSLSAAEKNYSQLEREALAVIFAVKKFHQYVYGRGFTIQTDHKPLLGLLGELKSIQPAASPRLQRWALLLAQYQYVLAYKPGPSIANADGLSRLPLPERPKETNTPAELTCLLKQLQTAPITCQQLKLWTARDPTLAKVCRFVKEGWPLSCPAEALRPFFKRQVELSVEDGILLWGLRVVIPPQAREILLDELHEPHPGISRMKSTARGHMWWPGLDNEIEQKVKACVICQEVRNAPPQAPVSPWEWPGKPWTRIHIDYAGPFLGEMFLIAVDAHSKWLEVAPVRAATSAATIEHLRAMFSIYGLPHTIVSDNAAYFTSSEFKGFLSSNGVRHITSAPYKPSTNGLVERAVQTVKRALKKSMESGGSLKTRISRFLAAYRSTPHATTGRSPAEMLFGRPVRTRWDLLRPDTQTKVFRNQERMICRGNRTRPTRTLMSGSEVWVRDFTGRQKWIPGVVMTSTGPLSYKVRVDGQVLRRHVDHLLARRGLEGRHQVYEDHGHDAEADWDADAPRAEQPEQLPEIEPVEHGQGPSAIVEGEESDAACATSPPGYPSAWLRHATPRHTSAPDHGTDRRVLQTQNERVSLSKYLGVP
ncbi:uncharacterized protein K02A2.6-like [Sardina pilchardus]|uniref:uncharacterized protein K02A2.6-like n=1 Tax=Sardina pilchardus TaxID=27697 RepID=UPI002E128827